MPKKFYLANSLKPRPIADGGCKSIFQRIGSCWIHGGRVWHYIFQEVEFFENIWQPGVVRVGFIQMDKISAWELKENIGGIGGSRRFMGSGGFLGRSSGFQAKPSSLRLAVFSFAGKNEPLFEPLANILTSSPCSKNIRMEGADSLIEANRKRSLQAVKGIFRYCKEGGVFSIKRKCLLDEEDASSSGRRPVLFLKSCLRLRERSALLLRATVWQA